jgi:Ca-activated chloride channel family protein
LLAIPVLIVLHYYFFEHTKKKAMKFSNFTAMKRVTGTNLVTRNTSELILRITILILIIFSAAQPVLWYKGKESITDYVIAIDSSASMISDDVSPDRFTVAKQAASDFLGNLNAETRVGLISFAGVSYIEMPPSSNLDELKKTLSAIDIQLSGGTDLGAALITSSNLLSPANQTKAIILITDGSDTSGIFVEQSLDSAIEYVNKNHIVVHTIGIGNGLTKPGYLGDTNLKAAYDMSTLRQIAETTGGKSFEVKSSAETIAAFREIENQTQNAEVAHEYSFMLLAIAFLLLFFEWGLLNTKFRAVP